MTAIEELRELVSAGTAERVCLDDIPLHTKALLELAERLDKLEALTQAKFEGIALGLSALLSTEERQRLVDGEV